MVLDGVLPDGALAQVLWPVVGLVVVDVVQQRARLTTVVDLENNSMDLPLSTVECCAEITATVKAADGCSNLFYGYRVGM